MAQDQAYKKRLESVEKKIFNANSVLSVDGLLVCLFILIVSS